MLLARSELARIATAFDESGDTRQLSLQLSRWLKQVAVLAYPQQKPHGLSGDDWLEFLDRALGGNRFSRGEGRVFADTVYRRRVDADAADLLDLCQAWLQAVTPRLLRRS